MEVEEILAAMLEGVKYLDATLTPGSPLRSTVESAFSKVGGIKGSIRKISKALGENVSSMSPGVTFDR